MIVPKSVWATLLGIQGSDECSPASMCCKKPQTLSAFTPPDDSPYTTFGKNSLRRRTNRDEKKGA
jgi:hypothetical protein